jgi:hypothetical protein
MASHYYEAKQSTMSTDENCTNFKSKNAKTFEFLLIPLSASPAFHVRERIVIAGL